MPTLVHLTGWEHQISSIAGLGIADQLSNASISTTTFRSGAAALRLHPSASNAFWIRNTVAPILVARAYVNFAVLPAANLLFLFGVFDNAATGYVGIGYNQASAKFATSDGSVLAAAGGPTVTTGAWYRLDFKADITHAPFADFQAQVDGTALASSGNPTGVTWDDVRFGGTPATSYDVFFDDLAVSATSADYPLGAGYVLGYSPNAVGTHVLDASPSSFFFKDTGSVETALSSSDTTSYQMIDDVPISGTDRIEIHATPTATTQYVEYYFASSNEVWDPDAVSIVTRLNKSTTGVTKSSAKIAFADTNAAVFTDSSSTDGAADYKTTVFATKPTGGSWTQEAFDNMHFRWGYTDDATPEPWLEGLIAEAAFGADVAETPSGNNPSVGILGAGAGW